MKIEGTCQGMELDVKRFYIPGVVIKAECPKCNAPWEYNLNSHYLSYPTVGTPEVIHGYCQKCEHEWEVGKILLKLSIEEVK